VRLWKEEKEVQEKRTVIAVNTSWEKVRFADAVFAMDETWWRKYIGKVKVEFAGLRTSTARIKDVERVSCLNTGNSGAGAIGLAHLWGADKIVLLGYDCKYGPKGERHHHGDHPPGLGNAKVYKGWPAQFLALDKRLKRRPVIVLNCSPDTDLKLWPRVKLEDALNAPSDPK
jgi:hypothetical protein